MTPEERADLVRRMRGEGKSSGAIAKAAGVSRQRVCQIVQTLPSFLHFPARPPAPPPVCRLCRTPVARRELKCCDACRPAARAAAARKAGETMRAKADAADHAVSAGKSVGPWLVLGRDPDGTDRHGNRRWKCRCRSCGFEKSILWTALKYRPPMCRRCPKKQETQDVQVGY